jgi:hypothetical protein
MGGKLTPKAELLAVMNAWEAAGRSKIKASVALGMNYSTYNNRFYEAKRRNINPGDILPLEPEPERVEPFVPKPTEKLELEQRQKDEITRLKRELADAYRLMGTSRLVREAVLGLTAEPIRPPDIKLPKRVGKALPEAVILHLSDLQWGEVVRLETMGGINSFNMEIAARRLYKVFQATIELMTKHWTGPPPCRLIVLLGGDLISGDIHEELRKTNELQSMPTCMDILRHLVLGFGLLLKELPCDIEVISVPGNHGRTTLKPESKLYVDTNYDTLIADVLEWHYKITNEKRIKFTRPESGDALFKVFGWQGWLSHGDRIGTKGGKGFVGPSAPIARGMKLVTDEHAAQRIFIDWIFIGHYHTRLMLEHGYANGCLPGPSEYSRDLRSRPKPASQNYFQVHPERGIVAERQIQCGDPSEGTIYQPRSQ